MSQFNAIPKFHTKAVSNAAKIWEVAKNKSAESQSFLDNLDTLLEEEALSN